MNGPARDVTIETRPGAPPLLSLLLGADSLLARRSGIGRVTVELAIALRRARQIAALRLWVGERLRDNAFLEAVLADDRALSAPRPRPVRIAIGRLPGVQSLRTRLRQRAMRDELASLSALGGGRLVYFETNMIVKPFDGATVTQIHDLSWLHHRELHPAERISWIERNLPRTLRQARRFVAVSAFTADAFARDCGVGRDRIDVVPNAVGDAFHPVSKAAAAPILAARGLTDRSFILSVSTLEPRKNFDRLLAAHRALPPSLRARMPLVIAGGAGWGVTLANAAAEAARRDGTLMLLGHVPDDELVALTARARAYAYVSLYEGFGLPVLEAMAAATPVVASATTATGETAGDAALPVDPEDVGAITAALRRVIEDDALVEDLTARGLRRAAEFSWDHSAALLGDVWSRALA